MKAEDISKLEVFNTPYKIKLKGFLTTIDNTAIYVFNSHNNIFAIELSRDRTEIELHNDLYNPLNLDKIYKRSKKLYKRDFDVTINKNEHFFNQSPPYFNSNLFFLVFNDKTRYYEVIVKNDVIKDYIGKLDQLIVSQKEFNDMLFEKPQKREEIIER